MQNTQKFKRILLVDNELNWLTFAKKIILEAEYNVQTTQSVKDGLKLVQMKPYELILVDLKKIEQEKEIIQELTKFQSKKDQFIVALFPTELTPNRVGEIFKLGVHDCVDKPYEKSKLLDLIDEQLAKRPRPDQAVKQQTRKDLVTILIIEDDIDWRDRLADYLKTELYQIEAIGDYSAAIKLLAENNFDLIILDLRLIDTNEDFEGMKLLEFLRKKEKKTPVIIVSAYGTVEHVRDGFKIYNICDYISKQHFNRNKYLQAVRQAIYQYTLRE